VFREDGLHSRPEWRRQRDHVVVVVFCFLVLTATGVNRVTFGMRLIL
jgi:hypothetical protein